MIRKKRTKVDWSKHKLTIKQINGENVIYEFAVPGHRAQSVIFINAAGIMAVTGDWGNWFFCREFHPSPDEYVSDGYWIQKLKIASCQEPYDFDSVEVIREIEQLKKDHELSPEEIEWLDELEIAATDGEYAFIAKAMDHPSSFDCEMIPDGKVIKWWLLVVFDAFDEICNQLQEKK
ncbi:MAG: hypothetical protein HQK96_06885 [Nitrospirae bacterium]|nr:hypothetical protein [Nitrospirota bacterium]